MSWSVLCTHIHPLSIVFFIRSLNLQIPAIVLGHFFAVFAMNLVLVFFIYPWISCNIVWIGVVLSFNCPKFISLISYSLSSIPLCTNKPTMSGTFSLFKNFAYPFTNIITFYIFKVNVLNACMQFRDILV